MIQCSSMIRCVGAFVLFATSTSTAICADAQQDESRSEAPPEDAWSAQLTEESFNRWREYLLPDEPESCWQDVAWRSQFWQAVVEAQIEGKPVLLWAMNGHPMGCV